MATQAQGHTIDRLIDHWDDPGLLAMHLQRTCEPSRDRPMDPVIITSRAQLLKARIRHLERARTSLAPHRNDSLDTELAGLRFKRKILLWLMFPVNDLPPEILTTIFHMVLDSSESPQQSIMHRLNLTWVCQYWRQVSINDKLFWNVIWFRDRPPFTRSLTWVERAGTAPLEIRIDEAVRRVGETVDPPKLTKVDINALLDKLLVKVATIRTLVVVVDGWGTALAALEKMHNAGEPPSLERFEIHRSGPPKTFPPSPDDLPLQPWPEEGKAPIPLCNMPRLRWLAIRGLSIDWPRSSLSDLTTISLRHLSMYASPSLDRWREVLASCPRLYRLSLDAAGPVFRGVDTPVLGPPVELAYLRDVLLADLSSSYVDYILKNISAPHVASLTVMNMVSEDVGPLFETFIGRFPELRLLAMYSLSIHTTDENLRRFARFLDTIRHLQGLRISNMPKLVPSAFLEDPREYRQVQPIASGKEQPDKEVFCPDLRWLAMHHQDVTSVISFAKGRRKMNVPLHKLYYPVENSEVTGSKLACLRELFDEVEIHSERYIYVDEEKMMHRELLMAAGLEDDVAFEDVW